MNSVNTYKRKEKSFACAAWSKEQKVVRQGRSRALIEEEVKAEWKGNSD